MNIKLELSQESVRNGIRELNTYAKQLEKKCNTLCQRLAEIGVEAAVASVRVDTGNLQSSIHFEHIGDGEFLVITDCEYAAFVEFGTGVVGAGTYSGNLPPGWNYDERRTPQAHDPEDPTLWYYIDPESGYTASTRGQSANGFMMMAAEEMRQNVLSIAKEVFQS